jgi:site-specific recombinase XerC
MVLPATGGAPRAQVALLDVEALDGRVRAYQRDAKSAATLRAYRSDWADFTAWCGRLGIDPLPASPATVSRYLTHLIDERGLRPSTLQRRLSSISQAHQAAGHLPPTRDAVVRSTLAGIRRRPGAAPQRQAAAILPPDLRLLLEAAGQGCCEPLQLRDRALLLLGFAGRRPTRRARAATSASSAVARRRPVRCGPWPLGSPPPASSRGRSSAPST